MQGHTQKSSDTPSWKAIAAMAENRVIGHGNALPWHLPEDFKFFKQQTMGHILVMGRKTYASIGKPLPGRQTVVLSRSSDPIEGVQVVNDLASLNTLKSDKDIYICGGADIYRQTLPQCAELFLTRVKAKPEGDAFFPPFEELFEFQTMIMQTDAFTIEHYTLKS